MAENNTLINNLDENICGLDDDLSEEEIAFLVGYNEEEKKEIKYKVNFISLKKVSKYIYELTEADKSHTGIFPIKIEGELPEHVVIEKLAEWVNHYSNGNIPPIIQKPIRSTSIKTLILDSSSIKDLKLREEEAEWYVKFFNTRVKIIMKLIAVCNYFSMTGDDKNGGLLDISCAYIATLIKGKSPDEIKAIFKDCEENN